MLLSTQQYSQAAARDPMKEERDPRVSAFIQVGQLLLRNNPDSATGNDQVLFLAASVGINFLDHLPGNMALGFVPCVQDIPLSLWQAQIQVLEARQGQRPVGQAERVDTPPAPPETAPTAPATHQELDDIPMDKPKRGAPESAGSPSARVRQALADANPPETSHSATSDNSLPEESSPLSDRESESSAGRSPKRRKSQGRVSEDTPDKPRGAYSRAGGPRAPRERESRRKVEEVPLSAVPAEDYSSSEGSSIVGGRGSADFEASSQKRRTSQGRVSEDTPAKARGESSRAGASKAAREREIRRKVEELRAEVAAAEAHFASGRAIPMSVRGSEFSAGRSRKGSTQPTPDDETIPATVDRSGDRVRQEMDADPQSAPDQERSASKARSSRRDRRQEVRREDPPAPSIRRRHK